jgi:hypothetical protein
VKVDSDMIVLVIGFDLVYHVCQHLLHRFNTSQTSFAVTKEGLCGEYRREAVVVD